MPRTHIRILTFIRHTDPTQRMHFKVIQREELYRGKIVDLVVDHIQYESGNTSHREIIKHPGGAVILAVFEDRDVLLVRQYRHPIGEDVIELPAGKLDIGEDPQHCAERELREETGYHAREWKRVTTVLTTPGFCDERLHIFLARKLSSSSKGQALDEGEGTIRVLRVPLEESIAMIERGEIVDGKSIAGILIGERMLR